MHDTILAEPVSGRSEPRPLQAVARHDVRFYGCGRDLDTDMRAVCLPCSWRVGIEGGHTLPQLARLVSQHEGRAS